MKVMKSKKSVLRLLRKDRKFRAPMDAGNWRISEASAETSNASCPGLNSERRWEIISAFGKVLETCSSSIERESSLPYPKELIRQAILEELSENPMGELRSHLEIAFVRLEAFLPSEEYDVMEEFRLAGTLAQEIAGSSDPDALIACARILKHTKGDRAVRIQEDISEEMRRRLKEIRAIGSSGFGLRHCHSVGL
jgi:hypothetical protein